VEGFKQLLQIVHDTPALRRSIVPLAYGNPGIGKTTIIKQFAAEKGVKCVDLIVSQMNPFELSGIAIPYKEIITDGNTQFEKNQKMTYADFDLFHNLKDGDILFFDEICNGSLPVLNACLTILENRQLPSGFKLPDIMIVAAGNPQGCAPMTPQIKERFHWVDVTFDTAGWQKWAEEALLMPGPVSKECVRLITAEDFSQNHNFYTPRTISKLARLYLKAPDLITDMRLRKAFETPCLCESGTVKWLTAIQRTLAEESSSGLIGSSGKTVQQLLFD